MPIRVGYIRARYPEIRNIIHRSKKDTQYVQIGKWHNRRLFLSRAWDILKGRILRKHIPINWDVHAVFKTPARRDVDVIHTFNAVCDTPVPWVCTFETAVPRTRGTTSGNWQEGKREVDAFTKKAFKLLRRKNCSALIAISEANKNIQLDRMERLGIEGREEIAEKLLVLPPPQPVLITEAQLHEKFATVEECVEFIFVGGHFFRKGGAQVIDSLKRFVQQGYKLHLTVISSLGYGDYASHTTVNDMLQYKKVLISESWITWYEHLPNAQVLELCKKAHIGLLPTFADTYGYSVLEMQACGCPVITTDVRALPEMNNTRCGYIFSVPKYPSTEAIYDTKEGLANLKAAVSAGLDAAFAEILACPSALREKAVAAVQKIATDHSPDAYAMKLSEIYERAVHHT